MTYVVIKEVRISPVKNEKQYLSCLSYDPYNKGNGDVLTVYDKDDAFKFSTLEAAEMAAVWVGGQVKTIK